ncbi:MAG TPA: hypothetical protein PKE12_12855 [Kiritimatiellia bacterium]|nr:hypothetical protein [Kiritimatiellia bacterium]
MDEAGWVNRTDEELLAQNISALGLSLEHSGLQPFVRQLHDELAAKGLVFMPPCHVGDEWFVPVGIPAIFIPFFLVHERLRKLERKLMMEVEGETPEWFMKLMRHEAAHAYSYAYRMQRKKKWQETFGLASKEDTGFYRPRPHSRSFVLHLDDWYAQAHPDEDFAETFAVWLTPGLDWRERYAGWRALAKLEYVDALMRSLAGVPPPHQPAYQEADYNCLDVKLADYYDAKRKLYEDTYPDFYDADLRQLFTGVQDPVTALPASAYLRRHRRALVNHVCQWTNERKYRVNSLLARLIRRCDELKLFARADDAAQGQRTGAYLATLVMNYLFTGKFKRSK